MTDRCLCHICYLLFIKEPHSDGFLMSNPFWVACDWGGVTLGGWANGLADGQWSNMDISKRMIQHILPY